MADSPGMNALLGPSSPSLPSDYSSNECLESEQQETRLKLRAVAVDILCLAVPNTAAFVLDLLNEVTNAIFIGRTGTDAQLAAVGMGNMMQNCIGLSVGLGLTSALDTFVSQAYGAQQKELCCYYLQRCRVVVTMQLIWMAPLLWYSESILLAMRQDPQVAHFSGAYNRASVFGLWPFFQLQTIRRFMMLQNITLAPMLIMGACSVLHVVWCYLFVVHLGWGNSGIGWANTTTWTLSFLMASFYLFLEAPRLGLRRWDALLVGPEGLRGLKAYYRVAIPATAGQCSEWWFWELTALLVGYLGKVPLAAHVSTMNVLGVITTPNVGIQISASTLVGNMLGANKPQMAKIYCWASTAFAILVWCLAAFGLFFGASALARFYSDEEDVRAATAPLMRIYALVGFCDACQFVLSGVSRCVGYQRFAAIVYVCVYFGVMMPLGAYLAFSAHWGVNGMWWSFLAGTILASGIFAAQMNSADWAYLARRAIEQIEGDIALTTTTLCELVEAKEPSV